MKKTTPIRDVETKIVRTFVDAALRKGYSLSVSLDRGYDIEEMLVGSTDRNRIMEECFSGDEAHIFIHEPDTSAIDNGRVNSIGWVYIVLGNDGWDVISDYSTNLDDLGLIKTAMAISERYSG